MFNAETIVSAHPRAGTRGVRQHPRRYLTREQIRAGRGTGLGSGIASEELIQQALAEGYAADGSWEAQVTTSRSGFVTLTLRHYAFPIAVAERNGAINGPWVLVSAKGRPGYGFSRTDLDGIRILEYALHPEHAPGLPPFKVGVNRDKRLRGVRGMGGRISPYAAVDEERQAMREAIMPAGTDSGDYSRSHAIHGPGKRFVSRRGRALRSTPHHGEVD